MTVADTTAKAWFLHGLSGCCPGPGGSVMAVTLEAVANSDCYQAINLIQLLPKPGKKSVAMKSLEVDFRSQSLHCR